MINPEMLVCGRYVSEDMATDDRFSFSNDPAQIVEVGDEVRRGETTRDVVVVCGSPSWVLVLVFGVMKI